MLPRRLRLTRSSDFAAVNRGGRRAGSRALVVHALPSDRPPRVGFVVSRSVGTAVVRNKVTRRLRHACRELLPRLVGDIVVRALPRAATTTNEQLRRDLDDCLGRAGALSPGRSTQPDGAE